MIPFRLAIRRIEITGGSEYQIFDLKKQKEETVSDAAMMVDPAGKKAVFFKDDQLFVTDIPKGKADLSKPIISPII